MLCEMYREIQNEKKNNSTFLRLLHLYVIHTYTAGTAHATCLDIFPEKKKELLSN